jgi:hypothetical protein
LWRVATVHDLIQNFIPSALLTRTAANATTTVIGTAIVTFRIIPTTILSFTVALLGFSAAQLGAESAFLTVWTCHHLSLLSSNRPFIVLRGKTLARCRSAEKRDPISKLI